MPKLPDYLEKGLLSKLRKNSKDELIDKIIDSSFTYFIINKDYHNKADYEALEKKLISFFNNKTKKKKDILTMDNWNIKKFNQDTKSIEFTVLTYSIYNYLTKYKQFHTNKKFNDLIKYLSKLIAKRNKKKDTK